MINPDRQIVLDTETTGMNQIGAHYEGHCIIEIGAVEICLLYTSHQACDIHKFHGGGQYTFRFDNFR